MHNQTIGEPESPRVSHRKIQTNGINMHIAEAGEGFPIVLLHGFPELWYSWRHQLPALRLGREAFMTVLRNQILASKESQDGFTLGGFRAALV